MSKAVRGGALDAPPGRRQLRAGPRRCGALQLDDPAGGEPRARAARPRTRCSATTASWWAPIRSWSSRAACARVVELPRLAERRELGGVAGVLGLDPERVELVVGRLQARAPRSPTRAARTPCARARPSDTPGVQSRERGESLVEPGEQAPVAVGLERLDEDLPLRDRSCSSAATIASPPARSGPRSSTAARGARSGRRGRGRARRRRRASAARGRGSRAGRGRAGARPGSARASGASRRGSDAGSPGRRRRGRPAPSSRGLPLALEQGPEVVDCRHFLPILGQSPGPMGQSPGSRGQAIVAIRSRSRS